MDLNTPLTRGDSSGSVEKLSNSSASSLNSSENESSTLSSVVEDEANDASGSGQSDHFPSENGSEMERKKSRVGSALTIENVRKYEEENDPVDLKELMARGSWVEKENFHSSESAHADKSNDLLPTAQCDVQTGEEEPHISYESPAVRTTTKGLKFTGEEYIAISVDVQTDESWLQQYDLRTGGEQFLEVCPRRLDTIATADSVLSGALPSPHRKNLLSPSDQSTSEVTSHVKENTHHFENHLPRSRPGSSEKIRKSPVPSAHLKSALECNPVIEINVMEMPPSESDDEAVFEPSAVINGVGLPKILQYKPESKQPQLDFSKLEDVIPKEVTWDDLSPDQQKNYQSILKEIEQQRKVFEEQSYSSGSIIDLDPRSAFGTRKEKKNRKDATAEKLRAKEQAERQKQTFANNQASFYAFARQLKTVNYALSSDKCMEEGWTIRPVTPPMPSESTSEFFAEDWGDIASGKRYHQSFVQKYYDNGRIFLAVFADGTGTVWYPSGNVAISIVSSGKHGKVLYLVQEDKDPDELPNVQAVFEPNGKCACYYPHGSLHVLLSGSGGEYFSEYGEKVKRWKWNDTETHVHAPPFQPITIGISKQAGVRILSQENVYLTFMDGKRRVRFNVGTRLKLKPNRRKLDPINLDALLLQEKVAYVQSIIERVHYTLQFPNSPRLAKLRLPMYLNSKLEKTAKLREAIGEPTLKSIKSSKQLPSKDAERNREQKKKNDRLTKGSTQAPTKATKNTFLPPVSVVVN